MTASALRAVLTSPLSQFRPDHWATYAKCASADVDARWWDGVRGEEPERETFARWERAVTICGTCPVAQQCWAARERGESGVRAGRILGGRPRRPRSGPAPVPKPAKEFEHGTYAGYRMHHRRDVPICEDCATAANLWRREYRATVKARKERAS